jgi:succinyl-diaminopimelate desuccinylase
MFASTVAELDALEVVIERHLAEVVELTRELVQAPSPNPPGDERAAAAVLDAYLDGVDGCERRLIAEREERPNLVFSIGEGRPVLALSAHLDTHRVTGEWTHDPFAAEIVDDRIYGLGTTDNKGAVAAAAVAFAALADAGGPPYGQLMLIANADEETGGRFGVAALREELKELPDAVVVAEPSGIETSFERLWIAARGTSRFRLLATGTETHSSLADHPGIANPIEHLEHAVAALRSRLAVLREDDSPLGTGARLIPVEIAGGRGYGSVPARAEISLELRVPPHAEGQTEADVLEALEGSSARVSLEFADGSLRWMAPSAVGRDDPLVAAGEAAWFAVLGTAPALGCFPGGTDARLYAERGIATLSGVGPGALVRAHHADEYVTKDELRTAARVYAEIARRYLRGAESTTR